MSESIITTTGPMATEPARIVGIVASVVTSIVAALVAVGVPVSPELTAAILGLLASIGPLVVALVVREKVYSPDSVRNLVAMGVETGRRVERRLSDEDGSGATLA